MGVGDVPALIEGQGGRSPELGRGEGNVAPLGTDRVEGERHGGIGDTAVAVGSGIAVSDIQRGTDELENGGNDLIGEDDGGRGDGVESALEEDALGGETVYFVVDALDLGVDEQSLVGGGLEGSVALDSVEGTTAALTDGHVFGRKERGRECAGRRRLKHLSLTRGSDCQEYSLQSLARLPMGVCGSF